MAQNTKISVSITEELDRTMKDAVERGEYGSSSEVVRDALRRWHRNRESEKLEIQHIRQLVQEGIDSGPGTYKTIEEIKKAAQARL
ncbi:MAG: type II toxin-antitoxin system ParD family antitoxin [Hyphomicrobiales bacterium]|nr:type II toxin-antitoxin system ParD family antitoxin [Hyphomicrobiales bacterium]